MRIRDLTARMISTSWRWAEESSSPIRSTGQGTLEAVLGELPVDHLVEGTPVDEGAPPGQLAGEDVLGHVHAGDDLGLLVDDPHARGTGLARVAEAQLLAVDA